MLIKTKAIVVAKLTEPCGAAQESQLYKYGTAKAAPKPRTIFPAKIITKLVAKPNNKNPIAVIKNPIGKILSCSFLNNIPKLAPSGIPHSPVIPVNAAY